MTPNSDDCRIYIDGTPYSWRDGQAVIFDETYIHSVNNDTDSTRLILFCDIDRPIRNPIMRSMNHFVANHIVKVTAAQNVDTEKVGVLNKISSYVYALKELFQRMKKANRRVYYAMKYAIMLGILYLVIFGVHARRFIGGEGVGTEARRHGGTEGRRDGGGQAGGGWGLRGISWGDGVGSGWQAFVGVARATGGVGGR